jgi:hypothetical protein
MVFDALMGVGLGILVGCIIAFITLFILMDAFAPPNPNPSWWQKTFGPSNVASVKFITKLASIPGFALGGGFGCKWISSAILTGVDWRDVLPVYMCVLALTYLAIMIGPLIRLIIKIMSMIK